MKILLIMPEFHDYKKILVNEIINKGHEVVYYQDSVKINFISKILRKIFHTNFSFKFNKHINNIKKNNLDFFDKVIIIFGGYFLRRRHVQKLKERFRKADFIYYAWDSFENFPNLVSILDLFDKIYSFDKRDCRKFDLKFLPLFYANNYIEKKKKYDLSGIFTFEYNRYKSILKIINILPENINVNLKLWMPSKSTFLFNRLRMLFRNIKLKNELLIFNQCDYQKLNEIYSSSTCVLDLPLKKQSGLTIRTIEVLNLRKKIITTNACIKEYEFYCPENIMVIDIRNPKIDMSFFQTPFNTDFVLGEKYSISSFVETLLL